MFDILFILIAFGVGYFVGSHRWRNLFYTAERGWFRALEDMERLKTRMERDEKREQELH